MKTFKTFLNELLSNSITKKSKFTTTRMGRRLPSDAVHIGTMKNGDRVHHTSSKNGNETFHTYYATGDSGRINLHLSTVQKQGHKGEKIDLLHGNDKSKGAHHLYQHLVTKHNKILVASDQSPGARHVWAKAAKHPQVNVHGYAGKKAIHAHPSEEEHYGDFKLARDLHRDGSSAKTPKERKKHEKESDHEYKRMDTRLVMHKK